MPFLSRALVVLLVLLASGAHAGDASEADRIAVLEARVSELAGLLGAQSDRIAGLEARLAQANAASERTRDVLARELAQPMLLIVGRGPCPAGFKRFDTRVWLLTRTRSSENGHLFDEAGLTYEDPPGVGTNVYRDLDLCFRPANAVRVE